jgi:hypothetical protein
MTIGLGYNINNELEELIKDNWDSSNTNYLTPVFIQIIDSDSKRYDFKSNKAMILFHRPTFRTEKNGVGIDSKRINHKLRVDIRVLDKNGEELFLKIYEELIRILDENIKNPFTGIQELSYEDEDNQDLSDKNKGLFRLLIPIRLINYCVNRNT